MRGVVRGGSCRRVGQEGRVGVGAVQPPEAGEAWPRWWWAAVCTLAFALHASAGMEGIGDVRAAHTRCCCPALGIGC